METIRQLLDKKGHQVWSVSPDVSVFEAIALMAEKEIGALVVMEGVKPVGMISERDYARNVILKGRSSIRTPVRAVMTTAVLYVRPDQTIEQCMAIVTEKRTRHLLVIDDNRAVVGLISIGDLVKSIINEQQFVIEQLVNYITG